MGERVKGTGWKTGFCFEVFTVECVLDTQEERKELLFHESLRSESGKPSHGVRCLGTA